MRAIVGRTVILIAMLAATVQLLYSAFGTNRNNRQLASQQQLLSANGQLTQLALSVAKLTIEHKEVPETLEEHLPPAALIDPWGTKIRYEVVQPRTGELRLTSAGPDRQFGTGDDIVFESKRR